MSANYFTPSPREARNCIYTSSLSPREARVGREAERGDSINTVLLSPALSSFLRQEERKTNACRTTFP